MLAVTLASADQHFTQSTAQADGNVICAIVLQVLYMNQSMDKFNFDTVMALDQCTKFYTDLSNNKLSTHFI